ncbi:Glycosyltransferase involved in cell wall bisynthesis [Altererythrobacter xiamenensis]|uniref:Glycosyltransferase involved in cell wall bisynthesis n=1 Tax=Altererythrobacter xiamenensis TaxID=1316679 RepID=A0A1Y6EF93_9SPHN|nr:glycosyltransferase family 4 protein [Altererythrobacter xiamenensis]SMQ61069.1 Glycosyltransferase involved in cell wall bisynthesis [Altererythrobacter xiamenensis]
MNPQRIIILNDRSKATGGATSLALLSARQLASAGYEVIYVTGDDGSESELPEGIELVTLGDRSLLELPFAQQVSKGLYNRAAARLVERVIDRFDTPGTVYHLHGWAQILSPAALGALSRVEDRLVVHAHDFFHACPNGTYFDFRKEAVCNLAPLSAACLATNCDKRSRAQKVFRTARMLVKDQLLSLRHTRALVAVIHPFMAEWLVRAGIDPDRIRVVRNPVKPFRPDRVEAERNAEIVFIGRVEEEKGADLAAEAARAAGRPLSIIGDGSDRARLAAQYPEITWHGWRSHAEIADLIGSARALIMPSRLPEPFGLVALEALQSGVPLVAFDDSFVAREAAELGCAFLARGRHAGSLASAVTELDDDERIEAASRAAFEQSHALSHTHESWRDGLLDLYRELLESEPSVVREPSKSSSTNAGIQQVLSP